jgi:two-component system nitrogen regulation response regulator GlnG
MALLLIVDDEPAILHALERALHSDVLEVVAANTAEECIEQLEQHEFDAAVLDLRLPEMSGLDLLDRVRLLDPHLPVILITAYPTMELAIEAMKRGAFEYLLKPLDLYQLREVVTRALELSRFRHVPLPGAENAGGDSLVHDRMVGRSRVMQEVYKAIGRVAPLNVPVLIRGESGTGKELVARALYEHSQRHQGPLVTINCAAIPETLLECELFGHESGAFTGADRRRIGRFEQAHLGTIFLDEIGDLPLATQPKLLRLLQEQQFERVGSNETIQTDVRVIAATNQNLNAMVASGRFRQDLFFRLKVFTIELPPLRDHLEDLPFLVEHFILQANHSLGKHLRSAAPETLQALQAHDWPGNVRELQSTIKYGLVQATGGLLTPDCLPESLQQRARPSEGPQAVGPGTDRGQAAPRKGKYHTIESYIGELLATGEPEIYRKVCQAVDRALLSAALRQSRGNKARASELLGISRTTLRAKLRDLRLFVSTHFQPEIDPGGQSSSTPDTSM